jgi:hypothetical protein
MNSGHVATLRFLMSGAKKPFKSYEHGVLLVTLMSSWLFKYGPGSDLFLGFRISPSFAIAQGSLGEHHMAGDRHVCRFASSIVPPLAYGLILSH